MLFNAFVPAKAYCSIVSNLLPLAKVTLLIPLPSNAPRLMTVTDAGIVTEDKLVVFNIGVGNGVDLDLLKRLSVKRAEPISVNSADFGKLFEFLGSSSSSIVSSGMSDDALYNIVTVLGEERAKTAVLDVNGVVKISKATA